MKRINAELDMSRISNATIEKLTRDELAGFGLYNAGICTYKGELKSRKKGFKTTEAPHTERCFETESKRFEFIKIQQTSEETEYAMRVYNKVENDYEEWFPVLWGCDFFK